MLDAWMWAREPKDAQGKRGGLKESLRWIEGYERVAETAASLPHTRLVYVTDREADMLALMARAQELDTPADWLIRSTHDRALPEAAKLWAATTEGAPLGERLQRRRFSFADSSLPQVQRAGYSRAVPSVGGD
ncbi:hypothetical protein BGV68_05325 [Burkholderia ubonensis]|nr:hypothetical protein BGV68_05325 [Burkholderia ubonensis]